MSKLPPFPGFNDDVKVGTTFSNREAVRMAGLHNQIQAGICFHSTDDKSAFSVVTRDKGGYIDDEDYGDELLYTGQGGRDNNTGKHIADQELKRGNRALVVSYELQKPIHLIRGFAAKGSTPAFYRYDGLFKVENYWIEKGRAGFKVFRFRLVEINVIENKEENIPKKTFQVTAEGSENPGRKTVTTSSPIRDQKLTRQEEIDYLKSEGIDMPWEKSKYSVNKGLWGTSVGGVETVTDTFAFVSKMLEKAQVKNTFSHSPIVAHGENGLTVTRQEIESSNGASVDELLQDKKIRFAHKDKDFSSMSESELQAIYEKEGII